MKKILMSFALIGSVVFSVADAQIFVNVPNTEQEISAYFQVGKMNANKGVGMPIVSLNSLTDYNPIVQTPKPGLLVYNTRISETLEQGYYYWSATGTPHWEKIGGVENKFTIIQNVDPNILGYSPTGTGANAPTTITVGSSTATKATCVKWELNAGGNGHVYCGYKMSDNSGKDFGTVFNALKSLNGYIVTITAAPEWDFVKTNILNNSTNALNTPAWIGYTSVKTPGNSERYRWITNETWRSNWGNNASVQSFFAANNPVAAANGQCNMIAGSSYNANREWYSSACNGTALSGANVSSIIVEFNQ
ncbi:lectin-like protein [Chryseobacterium sp. MMS23-Vi53]|uniref:lectin-like protein n=1 Tax=Chryseobacterium sp. MMS23-Vi53 TaxID=3386644 RepID=UPI0039EA426C